MFAVEFQTKIKDGTIEIPAEYRESFNDLVRVILMRDESQRTPSSLIDELLKRPIQLEQFRPFTRDEIYAR